MFLKKNYFIETKNFFPKRVIFSNFRKPKLDDKADADPQGSLMTMMKQLYDEGDDEMKRQIRCYFLKFFKISQNFDNNV